MMNQVFTNLFVNQIQCRCKYLRSSKEFLIFEKALSLLVDETDLVENPTSFTLDLLQHRHERIQSLKSQKWNASISLTHTSGKPVLTIISWLSTVVREEYRYIPLLGFEELDALMSMLWQVEGPNKNPLECTFQIMQLPKVPTPMIPQAQAVVVVT
jgi:hypothetical protein